MRPHGLTPRSPQHALHRTQRQHPAARIACQADDTYLNGECEERGDVFACYEAKREAAWADCCLRSKLPKVNVYSPMGDLSLAPSCLPGSPKHGNGTR